MDLADLGPGKLDPKTNAHLVQAKGMEQSADGDAPDYGPVPNMSCLGVTSIPFPRDKNGGAQGVVCEVPGLNGVLLGARDTRTSKSVGNAKPGDTILHSTGPEQAAQVQCKESSKQVVVLTKSSSGETIALVLDGKNDKVQIAAFGHMFELSTDGLAITAGDATLLMQNGTFYFLGTCVFGGMNPVAPLLGGVPPGAPMPGLFAGK